MAYMTYTATPGSYAYIGDDAAFDLSDDCEWRFDIAPVDWTPEAYQQIINRWDAGVDSTERSWKLYFGTHATQQEIWIDLEDGAGDWRGSWGIDFDVSTFDPNQRVQIRLTLDANNGSSNTDLYLYSRTGDDLTDLTSNDNWVEESSYTGLSGIQTWKASPDPIAIAGNNIDGAAGWAGKFYRAMMWSDLSQSTKVFDVEFVDANSSDPWTAWDDAARTGDWTSTGTYTEESGDNDLTDTELDASATLTVDNIQNKGISDTELVIVPELPIDQLLQAVLTDPALVSTPSLELDHLFGQSLGYSNIYSDIYGHEPAGFEPLRDLELLAEVPLPLDSFVFLPDPPGTAGLTDTELVDEAMPYLDQVSLFPILSDTLYPYWIGRFMRRGSLVIAPMKSAGAWAGDDIVSERFRYNSEVHSKAMIAVQPAWAAHKNAPTAVLKAAIDAALHGAGFIKADGSPLG